jgi:osmotically-inducible protein OsmY
MGPASDQDIEAVIYDALDMLAGTEEVEAKCENGRVILTGSVPHKRIKRDVGEIAWAIPALTDVQNNVVVAARRRGRQGQREQEPQPGSTSGPSRKQSP